MSSGAFLVSEMQHSNENGFREHVTFSNASCTHVTIWIHLDQALM